MTSQEIADQMLKGYHAAQAGVPCSDIESPEWREGHELAPKTAAKALAAASLGMAAAAAALPRSTLYPVPHKAVSDFWAPSEHSTHWGKP